MKFPNSIKPLVLIAALLVAGSASATTFDFSTFTLDVDLNAFSGNNVLQSSDGFSFDGYSIGSTLVSNVIEFTLQAKAGNKIDYFSFTDSGSFGGPLGKFNVADNFSDVDIRPVKEFNPGKGSGVWSFSASSGDVLHGVIAYDLKSAPGYSAVSHGGAFGVTTIPVPEPESFAMFLAGMGIMGAMARRRRHQI